MLLARVPEEVRSKVEEKTGMQWAEATATLELAANFEQIRGILTSDDPPGAVSALVSQSAAPLAVTMALRVARPRLEPHVKRQGLTWPDVVAAAGKVDASLLTDLGDPAAALSKWIDTALPFAIARSRKCVAAPRLTTRPPYIIVA